jgi:hypothetical protein
MQGGLDPDHLAVALAGSGQAGGDDSGVVEDDGVARADEARQVEDVAVIELFAVDDQHAGRVARLGRAKGDAVLGQVEVEVGQLHARVLARGAGTVKGGPPRAGLISLPC